MGKEKYANMRQYETSPWMLASVLVAYICISSILLRFLWNTYVVKLASGLRPINGILDAVFVKVFLTLVLN